ncbi:MAG: hypothetical protein U0Y68_09050 [Blastocatellia bacterium]
MRSDSLSSNKNMAPVWGQQCECAGCVNCSRQEEERCRHRHGQQDLFSRQTMSLYQVHSVWLCLSCLPKPIVEPVNLDRTLYNREMARLEKQETLFDFR